MWSRLIGGATFLCQGMLGVCTSDAWGVPVDAWGVHVFGSEPPSKFATWENAKTTGSLPKSVHA